MIRAVIVDDELHGRESLNHLLAKYCEQVQVVGMANGVAQAMPLLEQQKPDLIFLDINMPNGSGFDLLESYEQRDFDVIFTTAHDQYAVKAFRYAAVDYLLKPINIGELREAIQKYQNKKQHSGRQQATALRYFYKNEAAFDRVSLPTFDGFRFVKLSDIVRFEADGNYTRVFLATSEAILVSRTMAEFESLLEAGSFYRIHRSHLVNLQHVEAYNTKENYVTMADKTNLLVSTRKKSDFLRLMQ